MIAALVTLALGSVASTAVLAYVVRTLLVEQRRHVAALAAPTKEAAIIELRRQPRRPPADTDEPAHISPIGF